MKVDDIKTVAVIGAGFIGHGIAQVFATCGYNVYLVDVRNELLNSAITGIRANLKMMADEKVIPADDINRIIKQIEITTDLAEAARNSQFITEAINENLELKQKIFRDLDKLSSPDAILASNTSVISITRIASQSENRQRILGTHWWNPPYIIPLVEVIKAADTSPEVLEITFDLMKKAGKHPVKVLKDVPGFIGNRLQHALWREAISIVENGIADAASVDECVRNGFGIRLPVLGPLENADMVGLDLTLSIHDYILKYIESSPGPSPLLKNKVKNGELGFKSGKGFSNWTPEEARQSRERLSRYLLGWVHQKHK